MGCKGSKHKAAAQDAISPQKRTELPKIKTTTAVPATVKTAQNATTVAEPAAVVVPDENVKEVKDITVSVEGKEDKVKEEEAAASVASKVEPGKNIANGSPDRYSSLRKEDDGTESASGGEGLEYYSPTNDSEHGRLSNDGGRDEAPASEEKETRNTEDGDEEEIAALTVDAEDKIVQSEDAKDNELALDGATKETDLPAGGEEGKKDAEETKEG